MTPPTPGINKPAPLSILKEHTKFKEYYAEAEADSNVLLALAVMKVDQQTACQHKLNARVEDLATNFDTHTKAPLEKAHKIPEGWKPSETNCTPKTGQIDFKGRIPTGAIIKIIILIALIATGGMAANYLFPLLGGIIFMAASMKQCPGCNKALHVAVKRCPHCLHSFMTYKHGPPPTPEETRKKWSPFGRDGMLKDREAL